jgi:hypothetical protein
MTTEKVRTSKHTMTLHWYFDGETDKMNVKSTVRTGGGVGRILTGYLQHTI